MKKALTKKNKELYYYKDGVKMLIDRNDKSTYPEGVIGKISDRLIGYIGGLIGDISGLTGDVSGLYGYISSELTGNVSRLTGDVSRLTGDVSSELTGDVSRLIGDCTGISGNLSACELTDEEREERVDIEDLVV